MIQTAFYFKLSRFIACNKSAVSDDQSKIDHADTHKDSLKCPSCDD